MEQIKFSKDETNITITIPIQLLKFVAENMPPWGMKVNDEQMLADKLIFQLEHKLGSMGVEGVTGFQELIDYALEQIAESGEECIEEKLPY